MIIDVILWLCVSFIAYVYVGYPALLALLARVFPQKQPGSANITPTVTLLITAYNEEASIQQKLENSLALDYPPEQLQIVVAADGSEDGTVAIVQQFTGQNVVLSYRPERCGKMAAINQAMIKAQGEIIVFSDANNMYDPGALRELVRPFSEVFVGGVSGAKIIVKGDGALGSSEGLYWKYESFIKQKETQLSSCVGAAGEIFAIRRHLFESPPSEVINDDLYMALRLIQRKYRVLYMPRARSYERVSPSARDEMIRRSRIVAGRYQIIALRLLPANQPIVSWQIISHKYFRPLVPFAMLGILLANLVVVLLPGNRPLWLQAIYVLLLGLQTLFYSLAWLGKHVNEDNRLKRALYVPTFLVYSNWAALLGFYGYFSGRQTAIWQRIPRHKVVPEEFISKE